MAYSALSLIVVAVAALVGQASGTIVNGGQPIFCARAQITEVRIQGCAAEPCTIKKGTTVPVEIDLSFQTPARSDDVSLSVYNPYWNAPGTGVYGEYIETASTCQSMFPGACPINSHTRYTLKSGVFIHPESKDSLTGAATGERMTNWLFYAFDGNREEYSTCSFFADIKIVV